MKDRLSIYVSSPDSYSDVLDVFLKCFKRNWSDCPWELILTTNNKIYAGVNCICNNKTEDTWIERTSAALPHLATKYILLMCDDILICDKVPTVKIERILDYMDKYEIKYCRLKPIKQGLTISEIPYLSRVSKQTAYAINLQIGIFQVDYFKELIGDGSQSAWDIENKLNMLASEADCNHFTDIISVNSTIIPFIHGVDKGKWCNDAINYIKSEYPNYKFIRPSLSYGYELKKTMIEILQNYLSPRNRRVFKKVLQVFGMKFITKV